VRRIDQVLPAFNGEHDLNVDLRVGVSHGSPLPDERKRLSEYVGPTGLARFRSQISTNMPGLTALIGIPL